MAETILLFGAHGQVGFELRSTLGGLGEVVTQDRSQADFSRPETLRDIVQQVRPKVIVNAAAYTAVDKAEVERDLAYAINAVAPGVLAEEAKKLEASLFHYSTDYVFDGRGLGAYAESAATGPLSVYGATKLEGEQRVRAANPRSLILRTSWVYGRHRANFLKTMLHLAREREALRVVGDQIGAPTAATRIAHTTANVASQMAKADCGDPRWGLYHLTNAGEISWHGYARHAIGRAKALGMSVKVEMDAIEQITTADYPTPATRPLNSRMDTTKLRQTFGVDLPDWKTDMDPILADLAMEAERKTS